MENKVNLSALEIYNKEFGFVSNGYSAEAVEALLDLVIEDYQFFESFQTKLNELQILNIDITEKNEKLEIEKSNWFDKAKDVSAEYDKLNNEFSIVKEKLEEMNSSNSSELDNLKQSNHELTENITSRETTIKENEAYISTLELKLNALEPAQDQVNELSNSKATLEKILEEKNNIIQENESLIESLNSKLGKVDTSNAQIDELMQKTSNYEKEIDELKASLIAKTDDLTNTKEINKELNSNIKSLEKKVSDQENELNTVNDSYKGNQDLISDLQAQLKLKDDEIIETQAKHNASIASINDLEIKLTEKDKHISTMETDHSNAKQSVKNLEKQIKDMNYDSIVEEVKEFREEVVRIASLNDDLNAQIEKLTEISEAAVNEKNSYKEMISEKTELIEKLNKDLDGFKSRTNELEGKLTQEKSSPAASSHLELLKRLSRLEQKVYGRE